MLRRLLTPAAVRSLRVAASHPTRSIAVPNSASFSSLLSSSSSSSSSSQLLAASHSRSLIAQSFSGQKRWLSTENDEAKKITDEELSKENDNVSETENTNEEPLEVKATSSQSTNVDTEVIVGNSEAHEFRAETRKILDIVAKSLYSERQVFVRELISNASDALEKLRFKQNSNVPIADSFLGNEINIYTDEDAKTLTIQDYGIGMTKDELINNLGTIARSGTSEFAKTVSADTPDKDRLIGQFGVGFYSLFMVADHVKVYSKTFSEDGVGYCWQSDGSGSYSISEAQGVLRGTKIVMQLKDDAVEFAKSKNIKNIIEKYSNFVNFEIKLNSECVNKIKALWTLPKSEISDATYREFYRFISNSHDKPSYTLHFSGDSPLRVQALFFFPEQHFEKYGLGTLEPGISLFCRKVLIQPKMKGLLPDYLRFVKGVVDSEDIPLNLSRELLQDSALVQRLNSVLTRRVIKFLMGEAKKDPQKFAEWSLEFGNFIKEGAIRDAENREALASLIRVDSSAMDGQEKSITSLDEYISRMKEDQKDIYYLVTAKRNYALSSPYYEGFKKKSIEVLFFYSALDDAVVNYVQSYKGKNLVAIESANLNEPAATPEPDESTIPEQEINDFQKWIKDTLNEKVSSVKVSTRLHESPAIVIDNESASFRRMMRFADPMRAPTIPKQAMEINMKHPLMIQLNKRRTESPVVAANILEQVFDNALISAGLMDDTRSMIPRLNKIMEDALRS